MRFPLCRYATIYTMFPVFSLVLDQDVKPEMALLYPELYKDLTKVKSTFSFILISFFSKIKNYRCLYFSLSGAIVVLQDFPHLGFDQCLSGWAAQTLSYTVMWLHHDSVFKAQPLCLGRLSEELLIHHFIISPVCNTAVPGPLRTLRQSLSQYLRFPPSIHFYMQAFVRPVNRYFCNR